MAGMQTRTRSWLGAALLAAILSFLTISLAAPSRALALGDGDGFVATLWGDPTQAEFDEAVKRLVSAHAPDDVYHGFVQSEVVWGEPLGS